MFEREKRKLEELGYEELKDKRIEIAKELLKLRTQAAAKRLDNPKRLTLLRKQYARVLTFIHQIENKNKT